MTPRGWRRLAVGLVGAVVAGTALLVVLFNPKLLDSYTEEELAARIRHHVTSTIGPFDPPPELDPPLEPGHVQNQLRSPCEQGGLVVVDVRALDGLSEVEIAVIFDAVHEVWQQAGYQIYLDVREDGYSKLRVRHPEDGFAMELVSSWSSSPSLMVESPCIDLVDGGSA